MGRAIGGNMKFTKEYKRNYMKKWREDNREKMREYRRKWREKNPGYYKGWYIENTERQLGYDKKQKQKYRFGSMERYEQAFSKYDGWCAFACDKEAVLVHHLDGKSVRNSPRKEVDNNLSNLLPLCNSCHSKLHNPKKREII